MNDGTTRPFNEPAINLAADNYEAQERLLADVRRALEIRRISIDDLATELELSVEEASAWVDGEVDLRLSQVRHLANAIDAHITYRVGAIKTHYAGRMPDDSDVWEDLSWESRSMVSR